MGFKSAAGLSWDDAAFDRASKQLVEHLNRLIDRLRQLRCRENGQIDIIRRHICHELIPQQLDNMLFHLGAVIREGRCPNVGRLHCQPLFAVIGNRWIFKPEGCFRDLPQSLGFLRLQLLGGFRTERNPLSIRIDNSRSVIGIAVDYIGAILGRLLFRAAHQSSSPC